MENRYDKAFLKRLIQGNTSQEERDQFKKWLDDPQRDANWVRKLWDESDNEKDVLLGAREKILLNVLDGVHIDHESNKKKRHPEMTDNNSYKSIWRDYPFLRYAAIITLLLIPLFLFRSVVAEKTKPPEVQYMSKETHNGQHLKFRLEDGTKVILNANSSLTFPEHFTDSARHVTLKGEAFFIVAKDARRPFSVMSGNLTTTALGTSFNIQFAEEKHQAEVSLVTGSVVVEMKMDSVTNQIKLSPGMQLVYKKNKYIEQRIFNPLAVSSWKDGVIYFEKAGIVQIVSTLETWYDVEISVKYSNEFNRSKPWTYSGKFEKQSLENVLKGISYVKDFSFEMKGKKINLMLN